MSKKLAVAATVAGTALLLAIGAVGTFSVVGCSSSTSAASTYMTPGVYIVSVASFSQDFAASVRSLNPTCG